MGWYHKLIDLHPGADHNDACTMDQALTRTDGKWDARDKKIVKVADATESNDAVTYNQVMHSDTNKWDANKKKISNVAAGS